MQLNCKMKLSEMNPESKLWLYQSNRPLTQTEVAWTQEQIDAFVVEWAAHGTRLKAAGSVLNPYFIALAVDRTQADASGCSIDSSVRFLKQLGQELNVDFFNRLYHWVELLSGEVMKVHFKKLTEYPEGFVFNPLLTRLGDLDDKFKVEVSELYANI